MAISTSNTRENMDHLSDELARPEYAALSDDAAAAAINARTVTIRRPVETWRIRQAAIEAGYWATLVQARDVPATQALALNVLAWIDDQSGVIQSVDMDRPAAVAMRAALVAAGICTQNQADALAALADSTIPWTQSVGLPEVGIGLIRNARRSLNG
jgi:hypothetical protein